METLRRVANNMLGAQRPKSIVAKLKRLRCVQWNALLVCFSVLYQFAMILHIASSQILYMKKNYIYTTSPALICSLQTSTTAIRCYLLKKRRVETLLETTGASVAHERVTQKERLIGNLYAVPTIFNVCSL